MCERVNDSNLSEVEGFNELVKQIEFFSSCQTNSKKERMGVTAFSWVWQSEIS